MPRAGAATPAPAPGRSWGRYCPGTLIASNGRRFMASRAASAVAGTTMSPTVPARAKKNQTGPDGRAYGLSPSVV